MEQNGVKQQYSETVIMQTVTLKFWQKEVLKICERPNKWKQLHILNKE